MSEYNGVSESMAELPTLSLFERERAVPWRM
jgi:hypothetical protein